jgi:hypothetical protein
VRGSSSNGAGPIASREAFHDSILASALEGPVPRMS